MADLIMLGEIPGTSIVITFWGWLTVMLVAASVYGLVAFLRSEMVISKVLYVSIARSKRNQLKHISQIAL